MNEIFEMMKAKELTADCDTLNNLLKGYAKIGDTIALNATFEQFKKENVELLNADIFSVISDLDANGHTHQIDEFFSRLFKSLEYRYSAKSFITWSVQNRRFEIIEKLLANNADRCPLVSLAQHYLAEAVEASCTEDKINRIWHHLQTANITIESNIEAYFPAALRSSSASLVRATLHGMRSQALTIRDEHFIHLCHLESAKGPDALLDVMRLMRFDFKVRPRCTMIRDTFLPLYKCEKGAQMALAKLMTLDLSISTILMAVIARCMLDGRLDDAVDIAKTFKNHYFIATQYRPYLIHAAHKTKDFDNFVRFLRILRDDVERLQAVPKSTTAQPTKEQSLEQLYFGSAGIDEVHVVSEIIHDVIVSQGATSGPGRLCETEELLRKLLNEGLQISKTLATKIQREFGEKSNSPLPTLLVQLSASELEPRTMPKSSHFISPMNLLSSEELITIIEMAENRGRNVAGSKRLLFQAYISENNLLAAEDLMHDPEITHSKKIYSDLITLALDKSDLDKALDYLESAQRQCEKFYLLRRHAMRIVAMLLFRGHKYDEIQRTMHGKGLKYWFVQEDIKSAAICLLKEAGNSGDDDLVKKLFDYLVENDYTEPTVKTTAPLIQVHLKNGNVIDAFNAFEEVYGKYKCTPLKIDLCCKLIEQDDMQRLQQLFDILSRAHGEHVALRVLSYAFIQAGQIEPSAIVLSNHILVNGQHFLRRDCNFFYQRGRIDMLQGLLKATKSLDYDRTDIYRYLFLYYCKRKRERRATGDILDHIPNDEFLMEIKSLLKLKPAEPISDIEKIENVILEHAPSTVKIISGGERQKFEEKLRHLLVHDIEHISEATEIILTCLNSGIEIDPTILTQYLCKAAEMADTIVYDELANYSKVKSLPNFMKFYSQAHLNSANPMRYIHKIEKFIENVNANSVHHCQHRDDMNRFVCIEDNLRFLQKYPHVINNCKFSI